MTSAAIPIHSFPKICVLHRIPTQWEAHPQDELQSGWKCPKCAMVSACRVHDIPRRSGPGGMYCRKCRRAKIKADTRKRRTELAMEMFAGRDLEEAPGVAIIIRGDA